ncbi:MAG: ribosome recycling factor [Desulfovibrionaceae bacterium]|nr:ribosome recycling factor [Desulfovibrionaceae bacterium]
MSGDFNRQELIKDSKERMEKAIGAMEKEFDKLRTGRANPSLLENIKVEYNGTQMLLSHLSTITVVDSKSLTIKPWDKSSITHIEKAIVYAGIGLTPTNMGDLLRISIPPLTEERRKELAKTAKKMAEDAKIAIRNIRRDANDTVKRKEKEKIVTEDVVRSVHDEIQKLTDTYVERVDTILSSKEKEIMEV